MNKCKHVVCSKGAELENPTDGLRFCSRKCATQFYEIQPYLIGNEKDETYFDIVPGDIRLMLLRQIFEEPLNGSESHLEDPWWSRPNDLYYPTFFQEKFLDSVLFRSAVINDTSKVKQLFDTIRNDKKITDGLKKLFVLAASKYVVTAQTPTKFQAALLKLAVDLRISGEMSDFHYYDMPDKEALFRYVTYLNMTEGHPNKISMEIMAQIRRDISQSIIYNRYPMNLPEAAWIYYRLIEDKKGFNPLADGYYLIAAFWLSQKNRDDRSPQPDTAYLEQLLSKLIIWTPPEDTLPFHPFVVYKPDFYTDKKLLPALVVKWLPTIKPDFSIHKPQDGRMEFSMEAPKVYPPDLAIKLWNEFFRVNPMTNRRPEQPENVKEPMMAIADYITSKADPDYDTCRDLESKFTNGSFWQTFSFSGQETAPEVFRLCGYLDKTGMTADNVPLDKLSSELMNHLSSQTNVYAAFKDEKNKTWIDCYAKNAARSPDPLSLVSSFPMLALHYYKGLFPREKEYKIGHLESLFLSEKIAKTMPENAQMELFGNPSAVTLFRQTGPKVKARFNLEHGGVLSILPMESCDVQVVDKDYMEITRLSRFVMPHLSSVVITGSCAFFIVYERSIAPKAGLVVGGKTVLSPWKG